MTDRHFCGLYRGLVTSNIDPLSLGRIKVSVPDICGPASTGWVEPCVPVGGANLPALQSIVWIMCEKGDPDYLVWLGTLVYTPQPHEASGITVDSGYSATESSDAGHMT
jgi:Type VI secretion system/phage-baseplate injector OB domain